MNTKAKISDFLQKHDTFIYVLTVFFVAILFVFIRTYRISETLFFFNDMGRDFLVMYEWFSSGKPPLLGPQTSALPFNQSALYFYILFPFYIALKHSVYSSIIANIVYNLSFFFAGAYLLRKQTYKYTLPFIGLLVAIHPQVVTQHRFIWNPSFTVAPLIGGLYAYLWLLTNNYSRKIVALCIFLFSLATALSYSAAPLTLTVIALLLLKFKNKFLEIVLFFGGSLFILNIATVAFEIRHSFVLTKLLLHGEKLVQEKVPLIHKFMSIFDFSIYSSSNIANSIFMILFILVTAYILFRTFKKKESGKYTFFLEILKLFVITLILTLILPVSVQSHYVFPIVVLLLMAVTMLQHPLKYLLTGVLVLAWIIPTNSFAYMVDPPRTVSETISCAQKICINEKEPMFVSMQAGYHPFHNGMEFQYLFKENGCSIKKLDTEIDQAKLMAVVVDGSEYEHGKTAYNELTQFGESTLVREYSCDGDMEIVILKKN